jgi:hypothetical protein
MPLIDNSAGCIETSQIVGGDQEKMDGEDEQQGGIEAVTWGPGWGPEMDKAFGSQPIDEKIYDVVQPSGDGKAALSQMDSQIEEVPSTFALSK